MKLREMLSSRVVIDDQSVPQRFLYRLWCFMAPIRRRWIKRKVNKAIRINKAIKHQRVNRDQ